MFDSNEASVVELNEYMIRLEEREFWKNYEKENAKKSKKEKQK